MIRKSIFVISIVACSVSQPGIADQTIDPEALFAEAMKYRKDGELFKSIEIFERILSNQPGLNRARLELAISYHLTRRFDDAKKQLLTVYNDPETPDTVKLSITTYLAQLSTDSKPSPKRSSSSLYLSVGGITNSNINLSPDLPSASELSASGTHSMLTYSNRSQAQQQLLLGQKPVDFEWLSQFTIYAKAYASGRSDFNLSVLSLTTGPALIAKKSWRSALNFTLEKLYFGNQPYSIHTGINPLFTYSIQPDFEITLENKTTHRNYDRSQDDGLNGTMSSWSLDAAKYYTKQAIGIQAGIKYHDNGAKAGFQHYTGAEFYIGGQLPAWKDARSYLTLSSRDYRYKAVDTVGGFTEKRDETELLAVLGLSHNFRSGFFKSWTLNAEYTFTDNDTNTSTDPGQSAFVFDRNTFEVNMKRYFF